MPDGLLLLHAWPLDARMWEPQRAALPPGLPVAAPNHPGFGGSPLTGEATTMDRCAERALSALDEAGIQRALVCGLSMGGYVAFELWRRARERFLGLVLANTRASADTPEGREGRLALVQRLRREGNVLAHEPPALLAEDAPAELRQGVRSLIADQTAEAVAAASLGMAERPDSTPDLPGIDIPVLVIASTGDRLIPSGAGEAMAASIPGARLEILEAVGHLSNLEAPEAFTALLREHLTACGLLAA
ncbi:MAG TPA: alpha/beta fold hydrolase [Actinomycetota bacterium]|nr:alpha/beta fold hydrolase [Actinomycetota bacterium]